MVISLENIRQNSLALSARSQAVCTAVVKGDSYGHGVLPTASVLFNKGARIFYAARFDDGLILRKALPACAEIRILDGIDGGSAAEAARAGLVPVLNSANQVDAWAAATESDPSACEIHIDTGMNRLGISLAELPKIRATLRRLSVRVYFTHYASVDDHDLALCARQIGLLRRAVAGLPPAPLFVANSAGVFLGRRSHGDEIRPGKSTFGITPFGSPVPEIMPTAAVFAPVLQVREISTALQSVIRRRGERVVGAELLW
jgi:alanine racemase